MDKPLLKCRGWRSHAVSTTKGRDSGAPAQFTTEMESSHSSHAQNPFLNLFGIILFRTMLVKHALTEPNEQPMPDLAAKYGALHAERNL